MRRILATFTSGLLAAVAVHATEVRPTRDMGLLSHLSRIAHCHPGSIHPRSTLKPNPFEIFRQVPAVVERLELKDLNRELNPKRLRSYSMSFDAQGEPKGFSDVRLHEVRSWLLAEHKTLAGVELSRPQDFNVRQRVSFIALSPLLAERGSSYRDLPARIARLSGHEIEETYKRFKLPEKLRPLMSQTGWSYALEMYTNRARKILTEDLHGPNGSASVLRLEEVPPLVAILRGWVGWDCSLSSVPFYPLHKDVRVFWVHTSDRAHNNPDGYLLMTEIELQGRIVPYIITVNGSSIDEKRTRSLVQMVAGIYGVPALFLPGPQNKHVVNTEPIRRGLRINDRSNENVVRLNLPGGWNQLSELPVDSQMNFYRSKSLSFARLVEVTNDVDALEAKLSHFQFDNPYDDPVDPTGLPLLERAYLAAYAGTEEVRDVLNVTQEQVDAAGILLREEKGPDVGWYAPRAVLDEIEIRRLEEDLGLNIVAVLRELDPHSLTNTLILNHEWFRSELGETHFRRWTDRSEAKARQRLAIAAEQDDVSDMATSFYFLLELSALDDYRFWQQVPRFLAEGSEKMRIALVHALSAVIMKPDEPWIDLVRSLIALENKTGRPLIPLLKTTPIPEKALGYLIERLDDMPGSVAEAQIDYLANRRIAVVDEMKMFDQVYQQGFGESQVRQLLIRRESLTLRGWERLALWLQSETPGADLFFTDLIVTKKHWPEAIWPQIASLIKKTETATQKRLLAAAGRIPIWPAEFEDLVQSLKLSGDDELRTYIGHLEDGRRPPSCSDFLTMGMM